MIHYLCKLHNDTQIASKKKTLFQVLLSSCYPMRVKYCISLLNVRAQKYHHKIIHIHNVKKINDEILKYWHRKNEI